MNYVQIVARIKYYYLINKFRKNRQQLLKNENPFLKLPIIWLEIYNCFAYYFKKTFEPNDKQYQKRILIFKQLPTIFTNFFHQIEIFFYGLQYKHKVVSKKSFKVPSLL